MMFLSSDESKSIFFCIFVSVILYDKYVIMGYLDEDTDNCGRVDSSLGGMNYNREYDAYQDVSGRTETAADDDFMTSEKRRTECLKTGLEAALDAIDATGSDEAFNIAHDLYAILRTGEAKALLDKYL